MLLNALAEKTVASFFIKSFYDRGYAYYRENRVTNLDIRQLANAVLVQADVSGTEDYHVNIHVNGPVNRLSILGRCTCPMSINCKHVVAALLKAVEPPPVAQMVSSLSSLPGSQNDHRVDYWLKQMNEALSGQEKKEDQVDESQFLLYILSTSKHPPIELEVKLVLGKYLKSGLVGGHKAFSKTAYSQQKYLRPVDRELIAKIEVTDILRSRRNYIDTYTVASSHFENILPEILATGRCFWTTDSVPMSLGPVMNATPGWGMDANGYQVLRFEAEQKPLTCFVVENIWYIDVNAKQIGLVETGLDKNLARLILNAPKISPVQAKTVSDVLARQQEKVHLHQPQQFKSIRKVNPKPIPCLRLFLQNIRVFADKKSSLVTKEVAMPVAELLFDYQGVRVAWDDENDMFDQVNNDELVRVQRNRVKEENYYFNLEDYGLFQIDDIPQLDKLNPQSTTYFLLSHTTVDPLQFSTDILPMLREQGWRIEMADDYPYRIVDVVIDEWYSSIDDTSSRDWFGLELGISVGGEKINLLPILHKIIKNLRVDDQSDPDVLKSVYVQLPDGRYIELPTERVRSITNVLIELYDSESLTEDKILQLSKLHAARLLELEAAMGAAKLRWMGGENLRQLGAKLQQFDGIKHVDVPAQFHGELRPYQHDGLNWLQFLREYELGGILADDMGLGKTVQALSHIMLEKASGRMTLPCLVVAPTSLMFNWRMEAERFAPDLKVLVLHGAERKHRFELIANYDLVLTTYPLLVRDKMILLKQPFYMLILDEAQFIKNSKNLATQIVLQIQARHRLCLTGTPMENHLGELWSLFHFLMPGLLGHEKVFNRVFRVPIEKHQDQDRRAHLNRRVAPFLLRRTKDKVLKELPPKVEMIRQVELDGAQRDLYETIRATMQEKVRKEIANLGLARSHIVILDALLKLRQVCCDPRLLKISAPKKNQAKSAKLDLLMSLIPELIEEGRRILLFSQFTEMLGLIENELDELKISYVKLTGQTRDRATPVKQFQLGEVSLFLISLKAGGTGLNLTAADTVIHYDPWWNPAVENQATDRAHRIGQNKTVFVYKLVAKGTVEEKILEMQKSKAMLMEGLFSGDNVDKLKLNQQDLQGLFEIDGD